MEHILNISPLSRFEHERLAKWKLFKSKLPFLERFESFLSKNSRAKNLKYSSYSRAREQTAAAAKLTPHHTQHTNSKIHNIKREFFKINFRQIVRNSRFKNIWLLKNESKFILDGNFR